MNNIYTLSVREPTYLGPKVVKQENIGDFFLSTVRLPKLDTDEDLYETCLFREGSSEVIGKEYTQINAIICHERAKMVLMFSMAPVSDRYMTL